MENKGSGPLIVPVPYDFRWEFQIIPSPVGPIVRLRMIAHYGAIDFFFGPDALKTLGLQALEQARIAGASVIIPATEIPKSPEVQKHEERER